MAVMALPPLSQALCELGRARAHRPFPSKDSGQFWTWPDASAETGLPTMLEIGSHGSNRRSFRRLAAAIGRWWQLSADKNKGYAFQWFALWRP